MPHTEESALDSMKSMRVGETINFCLDDASQNVLHRLARALSSFGEYSLAIETPGFSGVISVQRHS